MKSILLLSLGLAVLGQATALAGGRPVVNRASAKAAVFTKLFNQADLDANGVLDEEEFGGSYGAHPRPVVTQFRFLELSRFNNASRGVIIVKGGVTLDAFILNNGGRSLYPTLSQMFDLADTYSDGELDPEEFNFTRPVPGAKGNSMKAFNKLDKDRNGGLSRAEFGIRVLPV